jgi:ZIP family zinc transporter
VAGSARLVGAAIGYLARVPQRLIAAVMAFGGGVLISALSFELMDEAYQRAGSAATGVGFLTGAAIYSAANLYLARRSAMHRKRSDGKQSSEAERGGSGLAIVIGVTMIGGGAVSAVAVAAIFISNVPEGLTSSAGMKRAHPPGLRLRRVGHHRRRLRPGGHARLRGLQPLLGRGDRRHHRRGRRAILAMLADTMIPPRRSNMPTT